MIKTSKTVKIGKKKLHNFGETFIIAEIGANHNGSIDLAKKLIKSAKEGGTHSAKFQLWSKTNLSSKPMYEGNAELIKQLDTWAFGYEEMREMKKYCDQNDIMYSCTPVTEENVDFLIDELDVEFMKVASMDVTNYPFLRYIAKKGKPIILSTGAATLGEIDEAVRTIENEGNDKLVLLHCSCLYPPKDEEINLLNIETLMDLYDYPIGYSDHTLGTTITLAAIARGACAIEKHFTLDKKMEGWDHSISADVEDLKVISLGAKRLYAALGNTERIIGKREMEKRLVFRRSIFADKDIKKGEIISKDGIAFKRPGKGIEPKDIDKIIGSTAKRDIKKEDMLQWSDINFKTKEK